MNATGHTISPTTADEIRASFATEAADTYAAADRYEARGDTHGAAMLRRSADSLARMSGKSYETMTLTN